MIMELLPEKWEISSIDAYGLPIVVTITNGDAHLHLIKGRGDLIVSTLIDGKDNYLTSGAVDKKGIQHVCEVINQTYP
jgi:hypothetical protein